VSAMNLVSADGQINLTWCSVAKSYIQQFLEAIDSDGTQQERFVRACDLLHHQQSSEYSRLLRAMDVNIGPALNRLGLHPTWKIVKAKDGPISAEFLRRCFEFVDPRYPHELSSQVVGQVLLRATSGALEQVRTALSGRVLLPSPIMVQEIAESVRQVTAAVALSTGLQRPHTVSVGGHLAPLPQSRFWRETVRSLHHWLTLDDAVHYSKWIGSFDLLRAALGRGAVQRISRWLRGVGLSLIDVARAYQYEHLASESTFGLPVSKPVAYIHKILMRLAALSDQAITVDHVILASLSVPSSGLACYVRATFGSATNLPLLYLRSAAPQGISREQAMWLVAVGDMVTTRAPSIVNGDMSLDRFHRLFTWSDSFPGFNAHRRIAAYLDAGDALSEGPMIKLSPFRTGDVVELLLVLSRERAHARTHDFPEDVALERAYEREADLHGGGEWAYEKFLTIFRSCPRPRLEARQALAWSQPSPLSLTTLGQLGGGYTAEELARLHELDPASAHSAVCLAHALASGVRPGILRPRRGVVHLFVGGTDGDHLIGLLGLNRSEVNRFQLDQSAALRLWAEVRRASLDKDPSGTHDALCTAAELIGIDRWSDLLEGRDVEITATPPFDSLFLDQVVRSVSRPRSIVHRVFGGGPGRWQGEFRKLRRAGGQRLVVADPSASLDGATAEAEAVAQVLGAESIGGPDVLRSTVIRALEESDARPQILHFAGHGVSGLVQQDGRMVSGVVAADSEAVTIEAMGELSIPRVLVASACDVGATPPVAESVGWATAAVSSGAAYSIAPGLPVHDAAALVFMLLTYDSWCRGVHLESAVSETTLLAGEPALLFDRWAAIVQDDGLRQIGIDWLRSMTAQEIANAMSLFLLASR
jgi:hypothetical protein